MAVAFTDLIGSIRLSDDRAFRQNRRVGAQAHGASEVAVTVEDLALGVHGGHDRIRSLRLHLSGGGRAQAQEVASGLDDHALQPQAQPKGRDAVLPGPAQSTNFALDPTYTETSWYDDRVNAREGPLGSLRGLADVRGHPADVDTGVVGEAAVTDRLGDGQVGVVQVDVLAYERYLKAVFGGVDTFKQAVPLGPVDVTEGQAQSLDEVGVQALTVEGWRDLVDAGGILALDDGVTVDVAHECHFALNPLGKVPVGAQDEGVRLDPDVAQ